MEIEVTDKAARLAIEEAVVFLQQISIVSVDHGSLGIAVKETHKTKALLIIRATISSLNLHQHTM